MNRLILALLLGTVSAHAESVFSPTAVSLIAEGKAEESHPPMPPHPFNYYLQPANLLAELRWDLRDPTSQVQSTWRDLGSLGAIRIREVRYFRDSTPIAAILLAEQTPGQFSPLLEWSGAMPVASLLSVGKTQVVVLEKDFGGNVPMVETWAWVETDGKVARLDVNGTISRAIRRVAPRYLGYDTSLNWKTLACETGIWRENEYTNKPSVHTEFKGWFRLDGARLVLMRAELRKLDEQGRSPGPVLRRWP